MSIEEELWCIFTNYTLKSNPMEPATLPSRQFLKLARETQLAVTARDLADAHIAISSQLSVGETFRRLGRKGKALTYSDFVAVLFQLAPKCHPSVDASFAFQKVLLENVLPLAQRRSVYSVESVLAEDEIKDLLGRQFARGIDGIFDWCVTMANSSQHAADRGGTNCFDARHNARIGYTEFLKFCETFKIFEGQVSRVDALLSVRAVGDVYLAATRKRNAYVSGASPPCVQDMTRSDFDEALVRIALHAYCGQVFLHLSSATKLRALFLYLWRGSASSVPTQTAWLDALTGCDDRLVRGAAINPHGSANFNATFLKMWKTDDFADYTKDGGVISENGTVMLNRIIDRAADLTPAQFSRFVDDGAARTHTGLKEVPSLSNGINLDHAARAEVRTSDIKRLLKDRRDIADLLHYQILEGNGSG